jgi:hypothetical protein
MNDRAWVGAKDQVEAFQAWTEAITHEWEKEPNKSIVFLELGIKQTAKIHTQLMALWKAMNPSITLIRVTGGGAGASSKSKMGGESGSGEGDLTQIEVHNPMSLFRAISSIDQQMRDIVNEFEFEELMMPPIH